MANVLVFAESRGGELRKVALEAVTAGRALAASEELQRGEQLVESLAANGYTVAPVAAQLGALRRPSAEARLSLPVQCSLMHERFSAWASPSRPSEVLAATTA